MGSTMVIIVTSSDKSHRPLGINCHVKLPGTSVHSILGHQGDPHPAANVFLRADLTHLVQQVGSPRKGVR